MNVRYVGEGSVELIAGGGRIYTDIAARFVQSEKPVKEIISSPYSGDIVRRIVESGHKAALEFDFFLFGVEGYSRVTEVQLVRKRLASYMIKSGRMDKKGKRRFNVVIPHSIEGVSTPVELTPDRLLLPDGRPLGDVLDPQVDKLKLMLTTGDLLGISEDWYNSGVQAGVPEEDLRYLKPQATEFKAIIGMNAHALMDWFGIRCCLRAQTEIRDMAMKMMAHCKRVAPDLFRDAGPNCRQLGYCPENTMQHPNCVGRIATKSDVLNMLKAKGMDPGRD